MGYMRHHAIIVTSCNRQNLAEAREQIVAARSKMVEEGTFTPNEKSQGPVVRLPFVSELTPRTTNDYSSFFIAPDGSKEGWNASDDGDAFRDQAIEILEAMTYEDGSSNLAWAEVQFGDEDGDQRVARAYDLDETRASGG